MKNYSSVLIIYNPNAMRGKIEDFMPQIKQRLSLRYSKVDSVCTSQIDDAEMIAEKNANQYDIVLSCGGDGTFHQVINGVMKSGASPIVGVLPFGTCNDVAKTLNISTELDLAIDSVLRLNTKKYDVMFDGKDYITYSMATGYLTKASYTASAKAKKKFGRFAYFMTGIKNMFKFESLPLTVCMDQERFHDKYIFMIVLNGDFAGGFRVNKSDNTSDGKVKVLLIKRKNIIVSLISFIKLFLFGIKSVRKSKNVIYREAESIEIENHSNTAFTVDGEKTKFLKKQISVKTSLDVIQN